MRPYLLTCFLIVCCGAQLEYVKAQSVEFVENKGQWDKKVKFLASTDAGAFYILNDGYKVALHNRQDMEAVKANFIGHGEGGKVMDLNAAESKSFSIRSHAYAVNFEGAVAGARQIAISATKSTNNYFTGNDPSKWGQGCNIYSELIYENIYPGIDIRYHTNGINPEYDFLVHPGADISRIGLRFKGVDRLSLIDGRLNIGTSLGDVVEQEPYSYQEGTGGKIKVASNFEIDGSLVRFKIGDHDKSKTLVIDPEIVFSSFTGSGSDNWGYAATYDSQGNFYSAGIVFGNKYPVSVGAYQTQWAGGTNTGEFTGFDIGIFKFNPSGTQRLYATYLGGSTGNELPSSLLVDAQDNLVICGRTTSTNFPTTGVQIGTGGGWDIFVSKLNSSGSILQGSRVVGGSQDDGLNIKHQYGNSPGPSSLFRSYGDGARSDIAIDGSGNIYIGTATKSADFPTTAAAFQPVKSGLQDGLLVKFNADLSSMLFSSCLGGTGDDGIYGLVLSGSDLFIAGGTTSSNFPGPKLGSVGTVFQGGVCDGFLAKINIDGNQLKRSCYIGSTGADQVFGIDKDQAGNVYIVGTSTSDMPVNNAAFSQTGGKQFIAKLDANFNHYIYSTVFGTNSATPNIVPTAFMVDRCENVYVAGWGGLVIQTNPAFPIAGTTGLSTTANALQTTTDGNDFYMFVLAKDATTQLYGSFLGQFTPALISDHSDGGKSRFSKDGTLYLAICANCQGGQFPTTPGAWSGTNTSGRCNQAAVKIKLDFVTCPIPPISPILYVDETATGTDDGSSWENACRSLLKAIDKLNNIDEITTILVAKGYYIVEDVDAFFINKSNAVLLGGYPSGGGTRDPDVNEVILQGKVHVQQSVRFDGFKLKN